MEEPIDPYLQWELHLLKLRAECGELIRVITDAQVKAYEADGPLSELVTLGLTSLYHIHYDDAGKLTGAVRVTDRTAVTSAAEFARRLYEQGEDLAVFFERVVASLPVPDDDPSAC